METNIALEEIKSIVETKVVLTAEEQVVADKITPHLKAVLKPELRKELDAEYAVKHTKLEADLSAQTQKLVQEGLAQWKKEQEPLSKQEVADLLSQEYSQFTIELRLNDGSLRTFTLCELPQTAELRFLKILREQGVPALKELVAEEMNKLEGDSADQLETLLLSSEKVLQVANRLVSICLDPRNTENINMDWVEKNLSAYRVLAVVMGQIEVNRYRDFLSNGFRISRSLKMD